MISILLVFLLCAVLQVAAVFFTRSVVLAAATAGARYGANSQVDVAAGGPRASQQIEQALSASMAKQIPCTGDQAADPGSGLVVAEVHCRGRISSIFYPIGALVNIEVTARSLKEHP